MVPRSAELIGSLALVVQDSPAHFGGLRVAGTLRHAAEKLVRRDFGVLLHIAVTDQPPGRIRGARREPAAELLSFDVLSPCASIRSRNSRSCYSVSS